jgi:hypothetical protein
VLSDLELNLRLLALLWLLTLPKETLTPFVLLLNGKVLAVLAFSPQLLGELPSDSTLSALTLKPLLLFAMPKLSTVVVLVPPTLNALSKPLTVLLTVLVPALVAAIVKPTALAVLVPLMLIAVLLTVVRKLLKSVVTLFLPLPLSVNVSMPSLAWVTLVKVLLLTVLPSTEVWTVMSVVYAELALTILTADPLLMEEHNLVNKFAPLSVSV